MQNGGDEGPKNLWDVQKTNNKMAKVGASLIVNTLNVNRLSSSIKSQRLVERVLKKMIQLCAVYKRPMIDLKTQTHCKWNDGKQYSMQIIIREKRWLY